MKKITIVKYILPFILSIFITIGTTGTFYFYNQYKVKQSYQQLSSRMLTIELLDSIFFSDDINLTPDQNSVSGCSLFHDDVRFRGNSLISYIKDSKTTLTVKACSYLLALQNIRSIGLMQHLYLSFVEVDNINPQSHYLLTSNSFPLNYKDKNLYSAFSINTLDQSLTKFGINRLIFIENSFLPHLQLNDSLMDPFTINYHPQDLMDLKDYINKIKSIKLEFSKKNFILLFIISSIVTLSFWKMQIINIFYIRAKIEFKNLLSNRGFIIVEANNMKTTLAYCSENKNIFNPKMTYYDLFGVEMENYDETTRFIKLNGDDFCEHYRLIDTEHYRKATHSRLAVNDKKIFDVIKYYKNNHTKDALTGLHNRSALKSFIKEHQHSNIKVLIALVDLDFFKRFNDTYGHDFGDTLLIHTADFFRKNFSQENDTILRVGGEEFLLLFKICPQMDAKTFFESIKKRILSFNQQAISLSGGLSIWDPKTETFESAHKRVDSLLYQSKSNGRAQITVDPILEAYTKNDLSNPVNKLS